MKYLLMIYDDEALVERMPADEKKAFFERYFALSREMRAAGVSLAMSPLQPIVTATSVRVRGGKVATTDGPFAETKEQLGGFYLIDVPDLDAALRWAAKIPSAEIGTVEVRPLADLG